jgi:hypothetical protein
VEISKNLPMEIMIISGDIQKKKCQTHGKSLNFPWACGMFHGQNGFLHGSMSWIIWIIFSGEISKYVEHTVEKISWGGTASHGILKGSERSKF